MNWESGRWLCRWHYTMGLLAVAQQVQATSCNEWPAPWQAWPTVLTTEQTVARDVIDTHWCESHSHSNFSHRFLTLFVWSLSFRGMCRAPLYDSTLEIHHSLQAVGLEREARGQGPQFRTVPIAPSIWASAIKIKSSLLWDEYAQKTVHINDCMNCLISKRCFSWHGSTENVFFSKASVIKSRAQANKLVCNSAYPPDDNLAVGSIYRSTASDWRRLSQKVTVVFSDEPVVSFVWQPNIAKPNVRSSKPLAYHCDSHTGIV